MVRSSIAVLLGCGAGSELALELGRRVRAARRAKGLTQSQLGFPLTKSYVSAIERGTSLPSLGALLLLADRLAVGFDELIKGVNNRSTIRYNADHAEGTDLDQGIRPSDALAPPREGGRR